MGVEYKFIERDKRNLIIIAKDAGIRIGECLGDIDPAGSVYLSRLRVDQNRMYSKVGINLISLLMVWAVENGGVCITTEAVPEKPSNRASTINFLKRVGFKPTDNYNLGFEVDIRNLR